MRARTTAPSPAHPHASVSDEARGWAGAIAPALTLGVAVGTCFFVAAADPTTPGGMSPPCPTKALFGIVCPGCGSARMVYSLLHADLRSAFAYNAVGVVVVVLLIWSFLAWTLRRTTGRYIPRWEAWRWAPITFGVVVAVWFVIRNLPFAPFTALAV